MSKRLTQLLSRYIGLGLVAVATFLAGEDVAVDQVAPHASAIAAALVGVGMQGVDLLIHRAETGGVTKPAGEKNPKKSS